ncbi:hypothetical protein BDA96_02G003700 [Sorghum bicolor]|uniref:Terpene synthase N-terminal domain-containing protein n=1 Tax=Sorghum bicolor TaxID=4558 RepID=A0A921RJY9_SORBI|nr:hypothetical protein BDA96_02G003700 [Sorghum bicolor]
MDCAYHTIMSSVVGVPPVVVCSDSEHRQQVQVAAAVDVESPPPVLQLRRRRRPLPLGASEETEEEEAAADDDDANLLQVVVANGNTDSMYNISSETELVQVQASLKDSVRRLLLVLQEEEDDDRSRLMLIRTIHQLQSLGIAYHFHQEIRGILLSLHQQQQQQHRQHHLDLHSAALLFRMLRGLGIPASTDMLMSALREEDDKVITDSDGVLALYQASYLAFPGPGETVLDQARALAIGKRAAGRRDDDDDSDCTRLPLPLPLPLHWTAPRLQAMWSLKGKGDDHNHNKKVAVVDPAILQLAQVDFNLVQALHRRELAEVTRWWKESGLGVGDYSFARDRVVECFFCAACIAPEPRLAECREVLAKIGALLVHLDDIYDVYGTLDELQAFTDAIAAASWENCRCNHLPNRVLEKHGYDMLPLYKKAWHELCKAFLVEAQWQQQGHMPSFAEYVSNGWVTSTGPLLLLHALPAAGIIPITQTQTQANNGAGAGGIVDYPRLVELSSTIFRLCNDCASHEAESERGDAPSSIACCMAEPWCAGEEQARDAVQGVIAETWKALNWEVVVVVPAAASGNGGKHDDDHGQPVPQPRPDHPLHLPGRGRHQFADSSHEANGQGPALQPYRPSCPLAIASKLLACMQHAFEWPVLLCSAHQVLVLYSDKTYIKSYINM